jgi:hypothetical protein
METTNVTVPAARVAEAHKLIRTMVRRDLNRTMFVFADLLNSPDGDVRVVFRGGAHGSHTLFLSVSSNERIEAHWNGYLPERLKAPKVCQQVKFPSGSDPAGWRYGKVLSVGPRRAIVEYSFKHGGRAQKTVPFHELFWSRQEVL